MCLYNEIVNTQRCSLKFKQKFTIYLPKSENIYQHNNNYKAFKVYTAGYVMKCG